MFYSYTCPSINLLLLSRGKEYTIYVINFQIKSSPNSRRTKYADDDSQKLRFNFCTWIINFENEYEDLSTHNRQLDQMAKN